MWQRCCWGWGTQLEPARKCDRYDRVWWILKAIYYVKYVSLIVMATITLLFVNSFVMWICGCYI